MQRSARRRSPGAWATSSTPRRSHTRPARSDGDQLPISCVGRDAGINCRPYSSLIALLHEAVPDRRQGPDRARAIGREPELLADVADVGLEQAGVAALEAPGVVDQAGVRDDLALVHGQQVEDAELERGQLDRI